MQALSIWPSKGGFLDIPPQFDFQYEAASFWGYTFKRDRRKGLEIVGGSVRLRGILYLCRSEVVRISAGKCMCLPVKALGVSDRLIKNDRSLQFQGEIDDIDEPRRYQEVEGRKNKHSVNVFALQQRLRLAVSVEDVENIMKDMDELPLQVFSTIIKHLGREKKLEPAMLIVGWLKKKSDENDNFGGPNLFIYESLLGAVRHSGQIDKVAPIMKEMQEAGIVPSVVTYNILMSIYIDQGKPVEALDMFEDIQRRGISPSSASYTIALLAYRRLEDANGALNLFLNLSQKYNNSELPNYKGPDWGTQLAEIKNFTSRICFQVMRQWLLKKPNSSTTVLKLLIEMDKADLPPTRREYEQLIWACTRDEHYTVVKELYLRLRERYSDISLLVCNHIIWLMGRAKKWWAALEIYEHLLEKGPEPDNLSNELIISHFNYLLKSVQKRGTWKFGVKLLNKMEEKGLKPGTQEWNAVLVACSKASEPAAAVDLFRRMIDGGDKPTIMSYGALLSALARGKLFDKAMQVYEHMLKVGVQPNIHVYTIMASVYTALGKFDNVESTIQEMISTGNGPTVITFNAIFTVCAQNFLGEFAYEWFNRMKSMSIKPDKVTYGILVEALAKDGKPKLAYDIYLEASAEGLTLVPRAYDSVIESSHKFEVSVDISALGPRPLEAWKK